MKNLLDILSLTAGQIIGGGFGIFVILATFIEITPIKLNPLSRFFGWIGKMTNHELLDKVKDIEIQVNTLKNDVTEISAKDDMRNVIACRRNILSFGDEIRRGVKHSHESFTQVLEDIDDYERYCDAHKEFENNKTVAAKKKILEAYDECLEKNNFL